MSLHRDLLAQARLLATKEPRRPKQASLRRSVSASYYALFHLLIDSATRRIIAGSGRDALRDCLKRAFKHGTMKTVAQQFATGNAPARLRHGLNGQSLQPEIVSVAATFVDLQQHRHDADYNLARQFTRQEVLNLLDDAERASTDWDTVRNSIQGDTFVLGLLLFDQMRV